MTVTLTGTGGLMTRVGAHIAAIEATLANEDADLLAQVKAIEAQYLSANQDIISGIRGELESARSARSGYKSLHKSYAEQVVIDMIQADNPQPNEDIDTALRELDRQMVAATASVNASVVTATATAGTNTGSAVVVASVKRTDGRNNELAFSEDIIATCTADAQTGGSATAGQEEWTFAGELAEGDPLSITWPDGSGAGGSLTAVDAGEDASAGNELTNSDFETWTVANTPDNWSILVGVAGTDIFKEVSVVYKGTAALKFTGTGGSPLSSIAQTLSGDSFTPGAVLHFNCFIRDSGAGLNAGVVEISLVDGSNAIVTDDQTANLAATIAHGTTTDTYASFSGSFQLPKVLPTTLKLRVRVSTALASGESVYIDHLSLTVATEAYVGGPYLSVHSGATASVVNDRYTVTVRNSRVGRLQEWFDRLFDMKGKRLQLRSKTDGTETVADSVIVPDLPAIVATVDPFNGNNATTLSDAVDTTLFHEIMFILALGVTDEVIDFKIVESATSGGAYTDVAGKAITQLAGTDDAKQVVILVRNEELGSGMRWVKGSVTVANGTSSLVTVIALGLKPRNGIYSDYDLASVVQVIV